MQKALHATEIVPLDVGFYTTAEAGRLLRASPQKISRWLGGYVYKDRRGGDVIAEPLWRSQLPGSGSQVELGFRDLIELRFVLAFVAQGVSLNVIRRCMSNARNILGEERPLASQKFRTDGRTIFLESLAEETNRPLSVVDLKDNQLAFKAIIEPTFRDLDWEGDVVASWRPHKGRSAIVIDPKRAFGTPVLTAYGIPTGSLAAAAKVEGVERAARLFETKAALVREAVDFESSLMAA